MAKPICPGLNLRPLQWQLRKDLGDLERLRINYINLAARGIIPNYMCSIDWAVAKNMIIVSYKNEKQRLIDRQTRINENEKPIAY